MFSFLGLYVYHHTVLAIVLWLNTIEVTTFVVVSNLLEDCFALWQVTAIMPFGLRIGLYSYNLNFVDNILLQI